MTSQLETSYAEGDVENVLKICLKTRQPILGLFLGKTKPTNTQEYYRRIEELEEMVNTSTHNTTGITNTGKNGEDKLVTVKLMCNWCPSETLVNIWNKMSKGNYTWNRIRITWEDPADYYVIINSPKPKDKFDPKKTIVFQMEPDMKDDPSWNEWGDPRKENFLRVFDHKEEYNNCEWHLSKTYTELSSQPVVKDRSLESVISTVLSKKYKDVGHCKRIDFVKFLEKKGQVVHVFGDNSKEYANYKGNLPYHCKDEAIFPYKYTFNAENRDKKNYLTEKLFDGILGECLVFYCGCYNAREIIDSRAFVQLELEDFEKDYATIKKAIAEDWHSQRLPYIREAKKKILEELQFFPRLERVLKTC